MDDTQRREAMRAAIEDRTAWQGQMWAAIDDELVEKLARLYAADVLHQTGPRGCSRSTGFEEAGLSMRHTLEGLLESVVQKGQDILIDEHGF